MSQNVLENQKPGYGLESPGQFYDRPQVYRELDGANHREAFLPSVDPGLLLGTETGKVHVPNAILEREPTPRTDDKWVFGRPEWELSQFRGQGDPPPLPEDPTQWGNEEWDAYFGWVRTNPAQMQMLEETYQMLQQHYHRQG